MLKKLLLTMFISFLAGLFIGLFIDRSRGMLDGFEVGYRSGEERAYKHVRRVLQNNVKGGKMFYIYDLQARFIPIGNNAVKIRFYDDERGKTHEK